MRRISPISPLLCALLALALRGNASDRNGIVPGRGIGRIELGKIVPKWLGAPDQSDAAMGGKRWLRWNAKKERDGRRDHLDTYSHPSEGDDIGVSRVAIVRVTSPSFVTSWGKISTRSSWQEIQHWFPRLQLRATYHSKERHGEVFVFDDAKHGIAFDVLNASTGKQCIAIEVHRPGAALLPLLGDDDWQTKQS